MINPFYTKYQELIQKQFAKEGTVVLFDILTPEILKKVNTELAKVKWAKDQNILTHSYSTASLTPALQHLTSSTEFQTLISSITKQKLPSPTFQLISCTWKEYTLLHDSITKSSKYDLIFDFTNDWDANAGGFLTYANGTGEYTRLPIHHNMLAIIDRKIQPNRYIQYCNHNAKGKRRILGIGSSLEKTSRKAFK